MSSEKSIITPDLVFVAAAGITVLIVASVATLVGWGAIAATRAAVRISMR